VITVATHRTVTIQPPPGAAARAERIKTSTIWNDVKVRWAVGALLPASYGVLTGIWTPRGPLTTAGALVAMVLGLATGVLVGVALRSRWAMLLAPVLFVAAFEIMRAGLTGPTVDGIHLTSTYGIMAFVVGRGFHGILVLLPMLLGASLGAALARRKRQAPDSAASFAVWLRRIVAGTTAVTLVALAAFIARPASTDAIVASDGTTLPGSVAELTTVDVGDHELGLMIRGVDTDNPVLLFLAGGPGGSELGAMRRHSGALEDDFVVATLDQRGTGTSYDQLDPTGTMTLDEAIANAVAATHYLRERFDEEKVYLVGQSWGTTLGVLAVQQQPELYRAYVGVGQMVSQKNTDRIFYDDTLAWAREHANTALVRTLEANGAPPYTDILDYEAALSHQMQIHPYDHSTNSEGSGEMSENIFVEEYTLLDQVHIMGATIDVFSVLYPQLQDIDFRTQATELDVPVYLAQGRHEAPGRQLLAQEWFTQLQAPAKEWTYFDTSGHRPLWEQPEEFHDLMTAVVTDTEPTR
jgi:proline iminopeptidase